MDKQFSIFLSLTVSLVMEWNNFFSGFGLRERAKRDRTNALFRPRNAIDLLHLSDT
jgi:hypothetical protein